MESREARAEIGYENGKDEEVAQAMSVDSAKETPEEGQRMLEISLSDLKPHLLVESLYERDKKTFESLREEMKQNGNRNIPAIQVIPNPSGGYLIIEGLTRFKAAMDANIDKLAAQVLAPMNETEILLTVVKMQYRRRKGDAKTLLKSVEILMPWATEEANKNKGKRSDGQNCPRTKNTNKDGRNGIIGKIVNKSATTIKHIRKVLEDEELTGKVLAGKLSINEAYNQTQASPEKKGRETNSSEGKSDKGTASLKKLQCKLKELESVEVWECLEALPEATLEFLKAKFEGYEMKEDSLTEGEENAEE